jgi:hypothetical protein
MWPNTRKCTIIHCKVQAPYLPQWRMLNQQCCLFVDSAKHAEHRKRCCFCRTCCFNWVNKLTLCVLLLISWTSQDQIFPGFKNLPTTTTTRAGRTGTSVLVATQCFVINFFSNHNHHGCKSKRKWQLLVVLKFFFFTSLLAFGFCKESKFIIPNVIGLLSYD